jgi:cysteine desulfurase
VKQKSFAIKSNLKSGNFNFQRMTKTRIYFDHAATTPLLPEVRNFLNEIMGTIFGNPSSTHFEGRASRSFIEEHRKNIATILNCSTSELYFTSCGTESNNFILKSAVCSLGVERVISTRIEHSCNIHTFEWIQKHDHVEMVYLDVDDKGRIDLNQLEQELKETGKKTLVSLMHVNNEIGTTIDIMAIGNLCKQYGALFHSDTVQGIGFSKYDLKNTPIDFISGSAHKFYAPKGSGFVYVNHQHKPEPFIHGGSQERNIRAGTENLLGIGAMSFALKLCYDHYEDRMIKLNDLKTHFKSQLQSAFPLLEFNTPVESVSPKILNVQFPAFEGSELLPLMFDIEGMSISGGSACTSGAEKPSHVISQIRPDDPGKAIRFSFAHFNTIDEVNRAVEIITKCLAGKEMTIQVTS